MLFIDPYMITSMAPGPYWALIAVIALIGALFLGVFAHYLKQVRLIEDTPTSKIRSAAQGFAELEGRCKHLNADQPLLSPLSQTPCVWYDFRIERKYKSGKNQTSWQTIQSGRSTQPILLDDGTGVCLLKPLKANVHSERSKSWYGTTAYPTKLSVERQDSLFQFGDYRYSEQWIAAEQPLYALGHFKTSRATDGFNREAAIRNIISEWKKDYSQMIERFDRNGDGEIDENEWKLVRLAASLEAEDLELNLTHQSDVNVMEKPTSNLPYIISTKDQKSLTGKLKWYYRIALVCTLVSLYFVTTINYVRMTHGA